MEDRQLQHHLGPEVLTSPILRLGAGAAAIIGLTTVFPGGVAFAGGNTGGCADSGNTVVCGAGTGGQSGGGAGTSGGGSSASGGGSTQPQCPDFVPYSVAFPGGGDGGPPPPGATVPGGWYVDLCAVGSVQGMSTGVQWFATGQVPGTPPPDPATVGAQAASELRLPGPAPSESPTGRGYVNLAEWLWISSSIWHPFTTTAQACTAGGCATATATATPAYVTWNTGDGSSLTCNGPGAVYNPALPANGQTTACSHTYTETSAGLPAQDGNPADGAFTVTATVTWTVQWTGPDGSAGPLPSLTTQAQTSLEVAQIESVNN